VTIVRIEKTFANRETAQAMATVLLIKQLKILSANALKIIQA
jgi:hypothetical protein